MELYRIFVNDIGKRKFSAAGRRDYKAQTPRNALRQFGVDPDEPRGGQVFIALPHSRMELWPDGKTGAVPNEALTFR